MKAMSWVPAWVFLSTSVCLANSSSGSFLSSQKGETPYEKLASAFASAAPMQVAQLPGLGDSFNWGCAVASLADPRELKNDRDAQILPENLLPFDSMTIHTLPVKVHASQALVSPDGPLFPLISQSEFDFVTLVQPGVFTASAFAVDDIAFLFNSLQVEILSTDPGFSQAVVLHDYESGGDLRVKETVRTLDGMVFLRGEPTPQLPAYATYSYCWKRT